MAADPALLATVWRGDVPEARVRGHVAVVDQNGRLVDSLGDPDAVTTLRSCVKPLQAFPFIREAADEDPAHRVSALHHCRLAPASVATVPTDVRPIYLRAPDAKPTTPRT